MGSLSSGYAGLLPCYGDNCDFYTVVLVFAGVKPQQCNHVVPVTQATVDSQNLVIKSDCLTCSGFRTQPPLYWNYLLLMFMEKITLTQRVMKMFYIQGTRFRFLTVPRYGITFKKKYFLQNDLISSEEVKKSKPQNPLDRKEKLCDISHCTNFTFPVVIESNKEFV